ncbi:MAG: Lrp/AsnC family transcriptional regulator [Pseudomonadota bacterium]
MDRIDRKILTLLQRDASIANNDLADRVGLSPSSCLRRVRQLKANGVITKTIALTDPKKMGRDLNAVVTIKLADHGKSARKDWLVRLNEDEAVSQAYIVSGETDVVVILTMADMGEYQNVSERLFSEDKNVLQFQTLFVLEQHKFDLAL